MGQAIVLIYAGLGVIVITLLAIAALSAVVIAGRDLIKRWL